MRCSDKGEEEVASRDQRDGNGSIVTAGPRFCVLLNSHRCFCEWLETGGDTFTAGETGGVATGAVGGVMAKG